MLPGQPIYDKITTTIQKQLEEGVIPWIKPWKGNSIGFDIPKNFITGSYYNGINILLLEGAVQTCNFKTHDFATFLQLNQAGERVKRGEKSTQIIHTSTFEKETDDPDKPDKIRYLKMYDVFNRSQLESFDPKKETSAIQKPFFERIKRVEDFVTRTGARIEYDDCIGASYVPAYDKIYMPDSSCFIDTQTCPAPVNFYRTQFHEIGHWTGHKSRMNRKIENRFGSPAYAQEELTAELVSAFTLSRLDITETPAIEHASYIASWQQVIKDLSGNKYGIIHAASNASKACDYLFALNNMKSWLTKENADVPKN